MKTLKHFLRIAIEGIGVLIFCALAKLLPLKISSNFWGWVMQTMGPHLSLTQKARRNLRIAFPKKSSQDIERIIVEMWDNLGRVAAEYLHLKQFKTFHEEDVSAHITVKGLEILDQIRETGKPAIFFSGHLANWELMALTIARQGLMTSQIYRAANNKFVNAIIRYVQSTTTRNLIPKGRVGARQTLAALQRGDHLLMLVDQKMNDGLMVPFFGRAAMAAPAVARLGMRFNCPIVPVQVERVKGINFNVTFYPPLLPPSSDLSEKEATLTLMTTINSYLECWIRQHPGQWLWIHERWPKDE